MEFRKNLTRSWLSNLQRMNDTPDIKWSFKAQHPQPEVTLEDGHGVILGVNTHSADAEDAGGIPNRKKSLQWRRWQVFNIDNCLEYLYTVITPFFGKRFVQVEQFVHFGDATTTNYNYNYIYI